MAGAHQRHLSRASGVHQHVGQPQVLGHHQARLIERAQLVAHLGLLLGGQKALPQRALADGYVFRFTDLDSALADLLKDSA